MSTQSSLISKSLGSVVSKSPSVQGVPSQNRHATVIAYAADCQQQTRICQATQRPRPGGSLHVLQSDDDPQIAIRCLLTAFPCPNRNLWTAMHVVSVGHSQIGWSLGLTCLYLLGCSQESWPCAPLADATDMRRGNRCLLLVAGSCRPGLSCRLSLPP